MTSPNEANMDALREMLAERDRYESWLVQLDQRRTSTPLHVLERVRADYQSRLEKVTVQLRGRAVELEATVTSLRSRLAALAGEEEQRRDERAETELRAAVGELPADRAHQAMQACDAAIGSLVAQRDALGSELSRLHEVLVMVMPQAAARSGPPHPTEELMSVDAFAPTGDIATVPEPVPSPVAAQELEFLRSVVSPSAEDAGIAQAAATAAQEAAAAELQPPLAAARRSVTPLGNGPVLRDPLRAAEGNRTLTPGNMPAFLKDMPSEQVKTLKCQECGTMNYPTEWYCEKCGGELAAM
jgi:hypothetical protein